MSCDSPLKQPCEGLKKYCSYWIRMVPVLVGQAFSLKKSQFFPSLPPPRRPRRDSFLFKNAANMINRLIFSFRSLHRKTDLGSLIFASTGADECTIVQRRKTRYRRRPMKKSTMLKIHMSKDLYVLKTKDDDSLEEVFFWKRQSDNTANRRNGTDFNVQAQLSGLIS